MIEEEGRKRREKEGEDEGEVEERWLEREDI